MSAAPPTDDWRPVLDTFEAGSVASHELQLSGTGPLTTLKQWREEPAGSFDVRASAIATMIIHDRMHAVRQVADGGVDLASYHTLACHCGGGLSALLESNIEAYIWLNQLLLLGDVPWHILAEPGMARGIPSDLASGLSEHDAKTARQLAAFRAMHELVDAYDNRQFRNAAHALELRRLVTERELTLDLLRSYIKEHIFPEMYRLTHCMLYNEVARGRRERNMAGGSQLEDPKAADAPYLQIEATIYDTIAPVLRHCAPPIEGVKRAHLFMLTPSERSRLR